MHALLHRHKLIHGEEKTFHTCSFEECDKSFRCVFFCMVSLDLECNFVHEHEDMFERCSDIVISG